MSVSKLYRLIFYLSGIQLFNNADSSCPERHGGGNDTKVYIDSGVPLVKTIWREDPSLTVSCYSPRYTPVVSCACPEYEVTHGEAASDVVQYYSGKFRKLEAAASYGLLAPVYYDAVKQLYLFSHHPEADMRAMFDDVVQYIEQLLK